MPYIKQEDRKRLDQHILHLSDAIRTAGDLNYAITRLAARFIPAINVRYEDINRVAGVLQEVAAEFYARVARPYEDLKRKQNGDLPEYAEWDALRDIPETKNEQFNKRLPSVHACHSIYCLLDSDHECHEEDCNQ